MEATINLGFRNQTEIASLRIESRNRGRHCIRSSGMFVPRMLYSPAFAQSCPEWKTSAPQASMRCDRPNVTSSRKFPISESMKLCQWQSRTHLRLPTEQNTGLTLQAATKMKLLHISQSQPSPRSASPVMDLPIDQQPRPYQLNKNY